MGVSQLASISSKRFSSVSSSSEIVEINSGSFCYLGRPFCVRTEKLLFFQCRTEIEREGEEEEEEE